MKRLVMIFCLIAFAALCQAQVPTVKAHSVHGCVNKSTGHGRVLLSHATCNAVTESAIEWTDSTGLPHVIDVPASGTPEENGQSLNSLLGLQYSGAQLTATNYVVQLDAGVYALPEPAYMFPYVSLQGAGMYSTVLEAGPSFSPQYTGQALVESIACVLYGWEGSYNNFIHTISNLTLMTPVASYPMEICPGGLVTVDRINVEGDSPDYPFIISMRAPQSHFTITNSILGYATSITQGDNNVLPGNTVSTIIGTEFDRGGVEGYGTAQVLCLSDYNSQGQVFNNNCFLP